MKLCSSVQSDQWFKNEWLHVNGKKIVVMMALYLKPSVHYTTDGSCSVAPRIAHEAQAASHDTRRVLIGVLVQ